MKTAGVWRLFSLLCLVGNSLAADRTITVTNDAHLAQAVRQAQPGDTIQLGAGPYTAGILVADLKGTADKPIRITGPGPEKRARIQARNTAFQFSRAQHIVLEHLHITGAAYNGINCDDGGDVTNFPSVSHHITLRNLLIEETGPKGTANAIKISGISQFVIEDCTFQHWGEGGGAAIDGVGVAHGLIRGCRFLGGRGSTGIQLKGGSRDIVVRDNQFEDAAPRAINVGGSTGLAYFRPRPQGFEAKDITIEGNLFVGGETALAFPGTDGATVRFNTIYVPKRWALRILQETVRDDFVPSRNVSFTDNLVVFRSDQWFAGGINIGPHTAPATYQFARNAWYCLDQPTRSTPRLPAQERDGIYGTNPLLVAPERGDYRLQAQSPLKHVGHTALPRPK